ncbi:MAG: RNA-binding protein [Pseudomonadota bacterium]
MKLYVGNLAYTVTDVELRQAFAEFGDVRSARVIYDRETARSRGYGFVELEPDAAAADAIDALQGRALMGRNLRISRANER